MTQKVAISSPWVTYYRQLEMLFGDDPDIKIEYAAGDGNDPIVKMYVEGSDKADAISELLPTSVAFGNVTMGIEVIPANRQLTAAELYRKAFDGNPALSYIATLDDMFSNAISYVVFRNKVVQYFNDNLGDVNGNVSTLYQSIAEDVFENKEGVCFCTDLPDNPGKPM